MNYIAAYHTDVGISKKTNQDSIAMKIVETVDGMIAFSIVCDGMGGLSKGELASKEVILAFCNWFDNVFIRDVQNKTFRDDTLYDTWNDIIQQLNQKLLAFGAANQLMLGTTLSGILFYKGNYYTVHVGDSRIYEVKNYVKQLTKDQSFVVREIEAGRMTPEQAKTDPRRSVLLQCIGASEAVVPTFDKKKTETNVVYIVCSDGFVHQVKDSEIIERVGPEVTDSEKLKYGCYYLTELVKNRKEKDNITIGVVRTYD